MKKARIAVVALAVLMLFAAVSCKEPHVHSYGDPQAKDGKVVQVCECGDVKEVDGAVAVGSADDLKDALNADSKFVLITEDIVLANTLTISRDVEINLGGKSITAEGKRVLHITKGNVVLSGKGSIAITKDDEGNKDFKSSSVIRVGDNDGSESKLTEVCLTIGKDIVVSSDFTYGVTVFGSKTKETLIVDGTIKTKGVPAVSGNGSTAYRVADTTITINGTVTTSEENAIYHPQKGRLTINGVVEGNGGIEMKAGELVLSDSCTVKATAETSSHKASSNGCSTSGYAIALVYNKDYAGKASLIGGLKGNVDESKVTYTISDN